MDLPPVVEEEKSIVKQALVGAGVTEEALSAFDDNALERLYRGGYKSNIKLNTAQRPGLVDCGLLPADVDFLLTQLAPPGEDFLKCNEQGELYQALTSRIQLVNDEHNC